MTKVIEENWKCCERMEFSCLHVLQEEIDEKKTRALFPMHSLIHQPHLQFKGFIHPPPPLLYTLLYNSATFQCLLWRRRRDEKYWNYRISILPCSSFRFCFFFAQKLFAKIKNNKKKRKKWITVYECSFVLNVWHPLLPTFTRFYIYML